jgi:predicted dehydrogenase
MSVASLNPGSERVRVAMIGVGGIAAHYWPFFAAYPKCELRAVYDIDPAAMRMVAERTGAIQTASEDALVATDVDAVVISTPNHLHVGQSEAALRAGKHVLLQKPMTVTAGEAERLVRASRETGSRLGLLMQSLEHPLFHDIRTMIRTGVFGRIGAVNAKLANGMGHRWTPGPGFWRGSKAAVGGGSFAMLAYHYVHLCEWLLDDVIAGVRSVSTNLMCPHIEGDDITAALVRFEGGAFGVIESAWCVRGEQMSVHGSAGSLAYIDNRVLTLSADRPFQGEVIRYERPGERLILDACVPPPMKDTANPHNQSRRFVDAILSGEPFDVPAEIGLRNMKVIEATYLAAGLDRGEVRP